MRGVATAIGVALGALAAAPSLAADLPTTKPAPPPPPAPPPSIWQFEITGYGWAPSIAGSSGFGALPTLPYYAPFPKLLEHLQGGLMGAVIARNDTFIVGLDAIWTKIGGSGTIRNPNNPLFGGQTDLVLTEGIVTAFGGLRAPLGVPNLDLYATVGARNFYSGTKLGVTGPFALFNGTQSVNKDWIMPVAGFAAQYRFDDRWFINALADLGGWSDSATGQALASVGYKWTPNFATTLGYRVMYTYDRQDAGVNFNFEPRSFRYQQWMYGPFAGFKFTF
ncbi:MAG TPA: hypothetical protein VFE63_08065 [Roseiarcus sp.]|jgi:hypothetical protein|nr:hypothetical protein [Roseiarcus sp.]